MGDVLEIQNSQLSCEEKSPQDILLALQTNQQLLSTNSPTANHAQEKIILEAKDAGDAISCRKEESPPLSSPQQPKAQPFTKDDESLLNENVPHSENSSAATAISQNVESQLMVMKPKENVAPAGSQLNVNETLASNEKDNPHTPSETDIDEETDDPSTGTNASSQVVRSENRRFFQQAPELYYVTEEIDDNSTESSLQTVRQIGNRRYWSVECQV
ncbi:uncharacterized protein LOC130986790 isoform X3 [Salvia miltiorrhiza]|uniref:uncharacterized protein LOC130986790 isoform X3 n=1 Tax=Salvia miltiorrhiza TaxID=226208 RepID=UPI0025AD5FE5|nr:uncharacterized protein LOC130986790 isoform X3 [Salvia miltiorrhiza]